MRRKKKALYHLYKYIHVSQSIQINKIKMEEIQSKTKLRINMCTHRRLNIQHEIDEHLRKQTHLSTLHSYKYQEELFHRKINHLKKNLEQIPPYIDDEINDEESFMSPNCSTRIQNHLRLLNFSSDTEKRLLSQTTSSNKFPNITQKRNSNQIKCRSAINRRASNLDFDEQKPFQSYLNQQIFDEQKKQIKNDQRKTYLLKEFDELKHTIDDPNSTFSVLAALSRAILFLDSATE